MKIIYFENMLIFLSVYINLQIKYASFLICLHQFTDNTFSLHHRKYFAVTFDYLNVEKIFSYLLMLIPGPNTIAYNISQSPCYQNNNSCDFIALVMCW